MVKKEIDNGEKINVKNEIWRIIKIFGETS